MRPLLATTAVLLLAPQVAAGIFPAGLPSATTAPWGAWLVQIVDQDFVSAGTHSLAIDDSGQKHVFYARFQPTELIHATDDGSQWNEQVVATAGIPAGMVTGPGGLVHLLQKDLPYLVYHRLNGDTHNVEVVDNRGVDRRDIAVDTAGGVHLAYNLPSDLLVYAYRAPAGGWMLQTIASDAANEVEIAVGGDGTVHIVYVPSSFLDARYVFRDVSGTWTNEEIPGCVSFLDIALDSEGTANVVCWYYDGVYFNRRLATDSWERTRIEGSARNGYDAALAIDSDDKPHVAYSMQLGPSGDDLVNHPRPKYASPGLDGWFVESLDHDGMFNGLRPSIQVDSHDRPHVLYAYSYRAKTIDAVLDQDDLLNPHSQLRLATPVASVLGAVEN